MLKKLNFFFNIMMCLSVGAFLASSAYRLWDYMTHPELYYPYSAPWYLSIQIYGAFTAIFLAVVLLVKRLLKKKLG